MRTNVTSIEELKNLFIEIFLNKQNKVNKVSENSTLNAFAYGIARIAQKELKDIAILESQLFPEYAVGTYLDDVAKRFGINERLEAAPSTVYIYLFGEPGTIYNKDNIKFVSSNGITFELDQNVTLSACKYAYAKAHSTQSGSKTNVDALSIQTCINPPSGHKFCINEFVATGGRDLESDEELQYRIKNIHNSISTKTLEYLSQIALHFNPNILKFVNLGTHQGRTLLGVYTQTGAALTDNELSLLENQLQEYFALSDISSALNTRIEFQNVNYAPINLNFRINYDKDTYSSDEIYSRIQRKIVNFLDWRFLNVDKITWSQLLDIVEHTEGVLSCPSTMFRVNGGMNDVSINRNLLPRFKSCLIYDLKGNSLIDTSSVQYMPVIYPAYINTSFESLIN